MRSLGLATASTNCWLGSENNNNGYYVTADGSVNNNNNKSNQYVVAPLWDSLPALYGADGLHRCLKTPLPVSAVRDKNTLLRQENELDIFFVYRCLSWSVQKETPLAREPAKNGTKTINLITSGPGAKVIRWEALLKGRAFSFSEKKIKF